jgi:hypothetical protein
MFMFEFIQKIYMDGFLLFKNNSWLLNGNGNKLL